MRRHDANRHRITAGVRDAGEPDRKLPGMVPFAQRLLGERHRGGRIHQHERRKCRAIAGDAEIRPIGARQQPPVETSWIVPLSVGPIFRELGRHAAQTRAVRSAGASSCRAPRGPGYTAQGIEQVTVARRPAHVREGPGSVAAKRARAPRRSLARR
jgi:hypothetical protein